MGLFHSVFACLQPPEADPPTTPAPHISHPYPLAPRLAPDSRAASRSSSTRARPSSRPHPHPLHVSPPRSPAKSVRAFRSPAGPGTHDASPTRLRSPLIPLSSTQAPTPPHGRSRDLDSATPSTLAGTASSRKSRKLRKPLRVEGWDLLRAPDLEGEPDAFGAKLEETWAAKRQERTTGQMKGSAQDSALESGGGRHEHMTTDETDTTLADDDNDAVGRKPP